VSRGALYTLGNFTIDDIVLWPDGRSWMGQPGGNVLFSALGARLWWEPVGILARVGSDYPRSRLAEIEARGLELGVVVVETPTLHDWALYEADGRRQFINHLNSGSNAAQTIEPDEIPAQYRDGAGYHIAPVPIEQQAALVAKLRRSDTVISLDLHENWIGGNEGLIGAILAQVDFFLPSELQARLLYGENRPQAAAREFARLGPRAVVIKLGGEGSIVYDARQDRLCHVPIYPAAVRDTTGAGDAYCGGFLAGYRLTGDAVRAAQYGTVSASYVIEAIGALATAQPSAAEAQARLALVAEKTRPVD
jgi:ribokinase